MPLFTAEQFNTVFPRLSGGRHKLSATKLLEYLAGVEAACEQWHIDTPRRLAAAFAQWGHETQGLVLMEEIWGPTDAQRRYEPPGSLATRLGNTEPGDGFRYRGRGPTMLTGRGNYRQAGHALSLDLEGRPGLVADLYAAGAAVAGWFWDSRGCNVFADAEDFEGLTRRINGGLNGLADRERWWKHARKVLGA